MIILNNKPKENIISSINKFRYKGDFKLSSGNKSNIYFNIKGFLCDPRNLSEARETFVNSLISFDKADFIGGMELGAVPLIFSLSEWLGIKAFIVRKESKNHGLVDRIISSEDVRGNIILVEDVVMTGSTVEKTINILKNVNVLSIICIVNRSNLDYFKSIPIISIVDETYFKD